MRAVILENSASTPTIKDAAIPEPGSNEVLARVKAASLNAIDVKTAEGALNKSPDEYPIILGKDFAGVIESVGSAVTNYKVGDEIVGFQTGSSGTFAEHVAISEDSIAPKPKSFDLSEAAGLPLTGCTALVLVNAINPSKGDRILVLGATGGVGSCVVQLAAARGAYVIATAKPDDDTTVRKFGASETIDYSRHDIAEVIREKYPDGIEGLADLVSDADTFAKFAALVASGGRVASVIGAANVDQLATKNVKATNVAGNPSVLREVVKLAESDVLKITVQHVYKFEEVPQAFIDFRQKHVLGKLIISIP